MQWTEIEENSWNNIKACDIRLKIPNNESISLVLGLKYFKNYILASSKIPQIYTDCRGVLYLSRSKHCSVISSNLSHFTSNYSQQCQIKLRHINGSYNVLSDLFSRSFEQSRFNCVLLALIHNVIK